MKPASDMIAPRPVTARLPYSSDHEPATPARTIIHNINIQTLGAVKSRFTCCKSIHDTSNPSNR